ncbi:MAG: trypsin-like peptidase domain-containing protein [Bacillota bacterium]|nr:trypsin-like peptidase domain-containing protein [Bacillota bacterium]
MENNKENNIKDVTWQDVTNIDGGNINFQKPKKKGTGKFFLKGISFVLVAALSGGITANYMVDKKYSQYVSKQDNTPLFQQTKSTGSTNVSATNAISKVAQTVGPAVVGIDNKVENFYGQESQQSSGSGIIFRSDGYIVTNNHVINGADKVYVRLSTGKILQAKLVGADPTTDLAVIKVDAKDLPVATFGDSSKVSVGETAIAIGNPLGEDFAGSVTAGIISALNRNIDVPDENGNVTRYKVLQTDAAINPGNSGGALCNSAGEVIGINSLKLGSAYNAEGMGFAISINEAKGVIQSLVKDGRVVRPFLGISGGDSNADQNKGVSGAYIEQVVQGGGAAKAGIQPGDIIIELDGTKISKFDDLRDVLDKHKVGDTISCKVSRNGKNIDTKITLTENTSQKQ